MIFVSDQDGSRILLINNNLKPIRSLTIDNFNNPDIRRFQSFTNSIQGLFVLAQNTNKIFKINEFSKIETEFGGWDTGNMVENPIDILSNDKNQLFVIDTTTQSISVFSTYGILEKNITPLLPLRWNQVKICDNLLLFFHSQTSQIAVYNLSTQTHQIIELSVNFIDIDFNVFNKEIVILQKNKWIIRLY